jgi:hypothetical protein
MSRASPLSHQWLQTTSERGQCNTWNTTQLHVSRPDLPSYKSFGGQQASNEPNIASREHTLAAARESICE